MHGNIDRVLACAAASVAMISLGLNGAEARDYTRSCTATIGINAQSPTGERLRGASYRFSGQGTVGYFAPNTARERARRNIDECIDAAWAHRYGTSRPSACTESNQVYSYPFYGLHFGVQQAVCLTNRGREQIFVDVNVQFSGDTGCTLRTNSWNRVVTQGYTINCPDYDEGPRH